MRILKQKERKNLSAFENFKLNNSKAIIGGYVEISDNGGPIDPPKKPGSGSGNDRPKD